MKFPVDQLTWTREPVSYTISADKIEIVTKPHTDLWQRTYYHFRNDNAPVLQVSSDEKFFSFIVKTDFASHHRFDQCDFPVLEGVSPTPLDFLGAIVLVHHPEPP